jgi:hypothetical protein
LRVTAYALQEKGLSIGMVNKKSLALVSYARVLLT